MSSFGIPRVSTLGLWSAERTSLSLNTTPLHSQLDQELHGSAASGVRRVPPDSPAQSNLQGLSMVQRKTHICKEESLKDPQSGITRRLMWNMTKRLFGESQCLPALNAPLYNFVYSGPPITLRRPLATSPPGKTRPWSPRTQFSRPKLLRRFCPKNSRIYPGTKLNHDAPSIGSIIKTGGGVRSSITKFGTHPYLPFYEARELRVDEHIHTQDFLSSVPFSIPFSAYRDPQIPTPLLSVLFFHFPFAHTPHTKAIRGQVTVASGWSVAIGLPPRHPWQSSVTVDILICLRI
ncbi:hypothetical protein P691DRAFT_806411 [Macrolepiota fuliginosa MF-IS2]|uniref:Uncharacterized protein n=1 Tax=Macrolepiota fuliginosa MF-IS2 TaxID=1400762 RepID=A0A9P6BYB0_9AGAR|nr:hypothetical protein P691DRAFT_806411 [Macrolepiota fuliginosa MF-IS2]